MNISRQCCIYSPALIIYNSMSYIWDDASILHFWYDTQHDLFEMISNQTIYANMPLNMITFVL